MNSSTCASTVRLTRSLLAGRALEDSTSRLKFLVSRSDEAWQIVPPGQNLVFPFMPFARTLAEDPVVFDPAFLRHALEADVARNLNAVGMQQVGLWPAARRDLSVAERVNAKQIEAERGHDRKRADLFILAGLS